MIATLLLAASTAVSFASTPEKAALLVFGTQGESARVTHVNRAGDFAAVMTSGGTLEGGAITTPILVQHFSFGWQAITLIEDTCDVARVPVQVRAQLMQTYEALQPRQGACPKIADHGSAQDVAAVRALMVFPFVLSVSVVHDFAIGVWDDGESLFRKRNGAWTLIVNGEDDMTANDLEKYGIPAADARALLSGAQ